MKEELDRQACLQAVRSSGKGSPKVNPSFATISLYYQLMPFDGSESALAQMITAIRDMTMNCLERASNSELPPVRDLELNTPRRGHYPLRVDKGPGQPSAEGRADSDRKVEAAAYPRA